MFIFRWGPSAQLLGELFVFAESHVVLLLADWPLFSLSAQGKIFFLTKVVDTCQIEALRPNSALTFAKGLLHVFLCVDEQLINDHPYPFEPTLVSVLPECA